MGVERPGDAIYFTSPQELRDWFDANHETATELWLGSYKKATGKPTVTWAEAVDEALCVGWIDSVRYSLDPEKSAQRFTPRRKGSNWSAVNIAKVKELTAAGRMLPAGRRAVEAARADGRWEVAYAAQSEAEVPADLAAAVAANPAAQAMFDVLTKTNRFALIYRLGAVKRPATRERKIAEFVEMLARQETPHPQKARPTATS